MNRTRTAAARRRSLAGAVMVLLMLALVAPASAQDLDPLRQASCRSLFAGTASTPKEYLPPDLPPDTDRELNERAVTVPTDAEIAALPQRIDLRTDTESFNARYEFALLDGEVFVRQRAAAAGLWRMLRLPRCFAGHVRAISADDEEVIAIDERRGVYTMDYGLNEIWTFNWTARWGPYFWANLGIELPADTVQWSLSDLTAKADGGFTDDAGNFHSSGGVTTIYVLRGDRQRITYLDPWLPIDYSYEMCGPRRGTLRMSSISASGSSTFAAGVDGSLWTRLYDFDISGANTIFVDYSYEDQRNAPSPRVQLPAPQWVEQPAPPGLYTDLVSIEKTGRESKFRVLRVEGVDDYETGYWEKDWNDRAWTFHATGTPLRGNTLPLAGESPIGPVEDLAFSGTVDGVPVAIPDFNPYCTPATFRVGSGDGAVDLTIHAVDGLRQEQRARGLDNTPREYYVVIETPRDVLDSLDSRAPEVAAFIRGPLGNQRFATAALSVTAVNLRFGFKVEQGCHELERIENGTVSPTEPPPFALRPRLPVDPGADLAALSGAWDYSRTAWRCH